MSTSLVELIQAKAIEFGDFTLASGQKANFYLDCRKLTLDAAGSVVIADAMIDQLKSEWPDAVGGVAVGAVPIVAAILTRAGGVGLSLSGFFVRREPKDHGTGQQLEGPVSAGQRVVIVEDVVTSGGSSVIAIEKAREFGLQVQRVIAIVDRMAGGAERFAALGVPFSALVTLEDLNLA